MERINSIDNVRGICIWLMIYGHMLDWWIHPADTWFKDLLFAFLEPLGATGFIFVSGISTALAFKSNIIELDPFDKPKYKIIEYSYFFRALLILLIAFGFNLVSLLMLQGSIFDIWSWLVLQTIGFSMIITWPFLKGSKTVRILMGFTFILVNQIILAFLFPYHGQANLYGILFHVLFNPKNQYIILIYLGIFLIGTVVGEFIFTINQSNNRVERKQNFKNNIRKKSLLFGGILMSFGFIFDFPSFLKFNTFSSIIYSIGLILLLLTILISIELSEKVKPTRSYRYLYFYSYYSFTIYLGHYIVYYLFIDRFNWIMFIILVFGVTNAIITILLRLAYIKLGSKFSLKTGINVLSLILAKKLVKKRISVNN